MWGEARAWDVVWGPGASGEAGAGGASGVGGAAEALPHHGGGGHRRGGGVGGGGGLVEALGSEERRRPYRITAAGASALEARLRSMEGLARAGLGRLATA